MRAFLPACALALHEYARAVPHRLTEFWSRSKKCLPGTGGRHHRSLWRSRARNRDINENHNFSVMFALERGRVFAKLLAPPLRSLLALRFPVGKPVLVDHRAHLPRRDAVEWIPPEQCEDIT